MAKSLTKATTHLIYFDSASDPSYLKAKSRGDVTTITMDKFLADCVNKGLLASVATFSNPVRYRDSNLLPLFSLAIV